MEIPFWRKKMNSIKIFERKTNWCLGDLIRSNETAFIGQCGIGPIHSLYLIVYEKIVLASCPQNAWSFPDCSVEVERFVDIKIEVIEK